MGSRAWEVRSLWFTDSVAQRHLPGPGIKPGSLHCQARFSSSGSPGKSRLYHFEGRPSIKGKDLNLMFLGKWMGLVAVWVMRFEEGDIIQDHKTMERAMGLFMKSLKLLSDWGCTHACTLSKLPFLSASQFLHVDSDYNNNNNNNISLNEIMKIKSSYVWKCTSDSNWHTVSVQERVIPFFFAGWYQRKWGCFI